MLVIIGSAIVTYLPRMLPLVMLSKIKMPDLVLRWLSFVPPAVLSALLLPDLLLVNQRVDFSFSNLKLLAAFPTLAVAVKTRSMMAALITGMATVVLLRLL